MRTETKPSFGFLVRGTSDGSKSGGRYLFKTLRSPMMMLCDVDAAGLGLQLYTDD